MHILLVNLFVFSVLWPNLIKKYGGRITDAIDISSLAKVTDGYTPGHMVTAIKAVLTERRVKQVGVYLLLSTYPL